MCSMFLQFQFQSQHRLHPWWDYDIMQQLCIKKRSSINTNVCIHILCMGGNLAVSNTRNLGEDYGAYITVLELRPHETKYYFDNFCI